VEPYQKSLITYTPFVGFCTAFYGGEGEHVGTVFCGGVEECEAVAKRAATSEEHSAILTAQAWPSGEPFTLLLPEPC
jgi:hypothetical protein